MSREIKFRIWNGNKFLGPATPKDLIQGYPGPESYGFTDDLVFQQFTGLLDKNGLEIYEGDIVKYTPFNQKKYKNSVVEVLTINKFHWFQDLENMLEEENKCDIRVIGNKFESPEYL